MKGFGQLKKIGQSVYFFKPHPVSLGTLNDILVSCNMSYDVYTAKFMDTSKMTPRMKSLCLNHHQHQELLNDLLTSSQIQSQY
jgi:hypothetical protein